jgi:hypothetical protein
MEMKPFLSCGQYALESKVWIYQNMVKHRLTWNRFTPAPGAAGQPEERSRSILENKNGLCL